MLPDKPFEYWIALGAATLWVWRKHEDFPLSARASMVAISAGLGVGLGPSVAAYAGIDETIVAVALVTFGYLVLDFGTALFSNNGEFFKDLLKLKIGKGE